MIFIFTLWFVTQLLLFSVWQYGVKAPLTTSWEKSHMMEVITASHLRRPWTRTTCSPWARQRQRCAETWQPASPTHFIKYLENQKVLHIFLGLNDIIQILPTCPTLFSFIVLERVNERKFFFILQLLRHPLLRVMRPADKCYLGMPSHLPALVEEEFLPQPWDGTRSWMGPGRSCHQKNLCLKASPKLHYTSRLMLQTKMQNTSVKLQTLPQRLHWMPAPLSSSSGVGNLLILKPHNAMYKATPPLLWLGLTFLLHRLCQHDAAASCGSGIPTCLPALCSDPRGWPGGKPWKTFSFISLIKYSISYTLVKCSLWLPLKTYTLHFTCIWWGEVNNGVNNNNNIQFAPIPTGQWQLCIFQQWIGVKL